MTQLIIIIIIKYLGNKVKIGRIGDREGSLIFSLYPLSIYPRAITQEWTNTIFSNSFA